MNWTPWEIVAPEHLLIAGYPLLIVLLVWPSLIGYLYRRKGEQSPSLRSRLWAVVLLKFGGFILPSSYAAFYASALAEPFDLVLALGVFLATVAALVMGILKWRRLPPVEGKELAFVGETLLCAAASTLSHLN